MHELNNFLQKIEVSPAFSSTGIITRINGMKIEVIGISVPIGTVCKILISPSRVISAEVIGFDDRIIFLMPMESIDGVKPGTQVMPCANQRSICVTKKLLGRIIDGEGNPLDGLGPVKAEEHYPLNAKPINPLRRRVISEPLDVGIRAINALLTIGKGQRIGIFSGSGIGKSVLLGMMTRYTKAHIVVVGLVGERGREVKEFIEQNLGAEGLARSVIVAAPSDTTSLMRVNSAMLATSIAEYFRDQGLDVLLIIDSLTRFAQAHREISLSANELPATKGFTPSVFTKLSQLVERSGNGIDTQGSITAFYTVLVEGDDYNDPIGDHVRSILDGHICLSRALADAGHYPAIDIEKSISRVATSVLDKAILQHAMKFKQLYSIYVQNKDLINVGMYQAGADKLLDTAIKLIEPIKHFLQQGMNESFSLETSIAQLSTIVEANV